MILKDTIILLCFTLFASSAFSQSQKNAEDSVVVGQLITDKLKSLKTLGVVNYLHLFSDAGTVVILYEADGKIKGIKCYYKGKRTSNFRSLRLSKDDKVNYAKCISMAKMDTVISFSNCKDFVHSFNKVVFEANTNGHSINGNFTSDCGNMLEKNGMSELYSIYKRLLVF